jgi:hypothetical protein
VNIFQQGSLRIGVYCFARALAKIDPTAASLGVRDGGAGVVYEKWTPYEAVALQSTLKLSTNQRIGIARGLKEHNGNKAVFPDERSCARVHAKHAPTRYFYTLDYHAKDDTMNAKARSAPDNPMKTVKYMTTCPFDALETQLKTFSLCQDKVKPIGVHLGTEGICLAVGLGGDHGDCDL